MPDLRDALESSRGCLEKHRVVGGEEYLEGPPQGVMLAGEMELRAGEGLPPAWDGGVHAQMALGAVAGRVCQAGGRAWEGRGGGKAWGEGDQGYLRGQQSPFPAPPSPCPQPPISALGVWL